MYTLLLNLLGILTLFIILYMIIDYVLHQFRITDLSSKYVFITGCDSGFGHLTAKKLDALGVNVFAGCYTEKGETELTKACSSRLKTLHVDIGNTESVTKAVDIISSSLPPNKGLWGVVNNAGILDFKLGPTEWMEIEDYEKVINVNLYGMIRVNKVFAPVVKKARGRIVNMCSVGGRVPVENAPGYYLSKCAVEAYSDLLRREMYPFGVSVHVIEPGNYQTGINQVDDLKVKLMKAWDSLSPVLRQEYGQCFVDDYMMGFVESVLDTASDKLYQVAEGYEHALFGRFPKTRYVIGDDRWMWLLLSKLPDHIIDFVIRVMFPKKKIAAVSG